MCYFLYGAINLGINESDYAKINNASGYHFKIGTSEDVNRCIDIDGDNFRLRNSVCDCNTAIGNHKTGKSELNKFRVFLFELQNIRGIKHVYISKNWVGERNESEKSVHIQDIDLLSFLADLQDNCLYKIDLYKKYY